MLKVTFINSVVYHELVLLDVNNISALSAVDREFKPSASQTTNYKIGICCFSSKHSALRSNSKDWLVYQDVSEWSDISTGELFFH